MFSCKYILYLRMQRSSDTARIHQLIYRCEYLVFESEAKQWDQPTTAASSAELHLDREMRILEYVDAIDTDLGGSECVIDSKTLDSVTDLVDRITDLKVDLYEQLSQISNDLYDISSYCFDKQLIMCDKKAAESKGDVDGVAAAEKALADLEAAEDKRRHPAQLTAGAPSEVLTTSLRCADCLDVRRTL